jgi:hypothetical protein
VNLRCDMELEDTEGLISCGLPDAEALKEVVKLGPPPGSHQAGRGEESVRS